jgi:DNA-binding transcriptional regulator YhcF (GntR family)
VKKKVPFSVLKGDGRSLVAQVTDGLREAIVGGYYKPGDVVPTSRELAPMLGVSRIVTIAALEKLCAEGFIVSRPRIGSVIVDHSAKRWNGHVVLVYEKGDDNYLKTMLASAMQNHLAEEGWLFSQASVGDNAGGGCDFTHLDVAFSRSVDLVVVMYHRPEIYAYLAKRKIPYVVFGEKAAKPASAVGAIHFDYNMANSDFAAACKAAGIKEVVQVYWHKLMCDVAPALKKVGIKVRKIKVPVDESEGRLIGVKRAGRLVFEKMLSRSPLFPVPLFFIADDYLTEGALLALSYAGLKIPEDVRLATWANTGLGPDYARPLSRMEMNPSEAGVTVALAIVEYLKKGKFPDNVAVGPRWFMGGTMTGLDV